MRRLARGYSIHLRSRAALIRRNDDFGIGMRRKTYPFGPFVRYEHFLRESCRRAYGGTVEKNTGDGLMAYFEDAQNTQWKTIRPKEPLPVR